MLSLLDREKRIKTTDIETKFGIFSKNFDENKISKRADFSTKKSKDLIVLLKNKIKLRSGQSI